MFNRKFFRSLKISSIWPLLLIFLGPKGVWGLEGSIERNSIPQAVRSVNKQHPKQAPPAAVELFSHHYKEKTQYKRKIVFANPDKGVNHLSYYIGFFVLTICFLLFETLIRIQQNIESSNASKKDSSHGRSNKREEKSLLPSLFAWLCIGALYLYLEKVHLRPFHTLIYPYKSGFPFLKVVRYALLYLLFFTAHLGILIYGRLHHFAYIKTATPKRSAQQPSTETEEEEIPPSQKNWILPTITYLIRNLTTSSLRIFRLLLSTYALQMLAHRIDSIWKRAFAATLITTTIYIINFFARYAYYKRTPTLAILHHIAYDLINNYATLHLNDLSLRLGVMLMKNIISFVKDAISRDQKLYQDYIFTTTIKLEPLRMAERFQKEQSGRSVPSAQLSTKGSQPSPQKAPQPSPELQRVQQIDSGYTKNIPSTEHKGRIGQYLLALNKAYPKSYYGALSLLMISLDLIFFFAIGSGIAASPQSTLSHADYQLSAHPASDQK